jgi:outer membrane protein
MKFNTKAPLAINGAVVPDSNATLDSVTTLGLELAYAWSDRVSLRLLVGYPPTSKLVGHMPGTTLEAGKVTFGPLVGSATWSPGTWGGFKPYVGAGIVYAVVLNEQDSAAISDLKVKPAWGSALEVGADYALDQHWGLFTDVRYIYLKSSASGTAPGFGGASVTAQGRLDPLAVHVGVSYRF